MSDPAMASWPGDGLLLCSTEYMAGTQPALSVIAPDSTGGLFVIGDFSASGGHVCLDVRVDPSGTTTAWPTSGEAPPVGPRVAFSDGLGGVIVIWHDYSTGAGARWLAGRWDALGAPAWSGNPVVLAAGHASSSAARMCMDGSGGAFIAWVDSTNNRDLYVQHVRADGAVVIGDGVIVCSAAGARAITSIIADGSGGAIFSWSDGRDLGTQGLDVYVQRVDDDLAPMWTAGGVPVCALPFHQYDSVLASDQAGGVIVAWVDGRNDLGTPGAPVPAYDVFAQHLDGNGSIDSSWPADGVPVSLAPGNQNTVRAVADGAGGAYIAWASGDPAACPVLAQHLAPTGLPAPGWPTGGMPGSTNGTSGPFPGGVFYELLPDHAGGAYVVWGVTDPTWSIRAQHWDATGALAPGWPAEGVSIITSSSYTVYPTLEAVTDDARGDLYAVWYTAIGGTTNRNFTRVVQHLGTDGVVAVRLSLVAATAEPGEVRLLWHSGGDPLDAMTLERRQGSQAWTPRAELTPDGNGNLSYEDHDVVSGERYGYRLAYSSGGSLVHTDEILVDVPAEFDLAFDQALPNPVLGPLQVGFTLPVSARGARLEMLDVTGRRVWSLEVGDLGPGHHSIAAPRAIPAGAYFLRLSSAGHAVSTGVVKLN